MIFSILFLHFQNLHKNLDTLEKKMSLRGYFFLKLYMAKAPLHKCLKQKRAYINALNDPCQNIYGQSMC